MKRKFLAGVTALSVIFLLSCNELSKNQPTTSKSKATDTIVTHGHTSANSLNIEGEYKGIIPCADCEGIETKIILNKDGSYIKQTKYLGKNGKVFEETGLYSWNKDGNKITLNGINKGPNQYFVGENKLIQLDTEGNRITGDLAGKYILLK